MQIKVQFNPFSGLVAMVVGCGLIFMEPETFKSYYKGLGQIRSEIDDWELKRGQGELDTESALSAFEEMLTNGW